MIETRHQGTLIGHPADPVDISGFRRPLFLVNVALFAGILIGIDLWMASFTDWFAAVNGVMAITAAAAIVGMLSKLITDDVRNATLIWVRNILVARRFRRWLAAGCLFWFLLVTFVGSLRIESLQIQNPRDRLVKVTGRSAAVRLQPTDVMHFPFWVWPHRPTTVLVTIDGFPTASLLVRSWRITTLKVPDDVLRPVLHLRPSRLLLSVALAHSGDARYQAEVVPPEGPSIRRPWDGDALLIGSESVEVPAEVLTAWKSELERQGAGSVISHWTHTDLTFSRMPGLTPSKQVLVRIYYPNGNLYSETRVTVQEVHSSQDLVQFLQIEDPIE